MSSGEKNSIIYKINDHFKLPVYYNSDKVELNKNIIDDLELIRTDDNQTTPYIHSVLTTTTTSPKLSPTKCLDIILPTPIS